MIDEKTLTKDQLRKLNALRKSVGDKIGGLAFSEWLKIQATAKVEKTDMQRMLILICNQDTKAECLLQS